MKHISITDKKGYHPVTRWLHFALALSVIFQISVALFMAHPDHHGDKGHESTTVAIGAPNVSEHHQDNNSHEDAQAHNKHEESKLSAALMEAHQTAGVLVVLIVLLNVIWAIMRRGASRSRQVSVLFSKQRWWEAITIVKTLPKMLIGKIPLAEPGNALSLIVEMLGLLTMTAMAITGFVIWNTWAGLGNTVSEFSQLVMQIHAGFAVILFVYLAGHVSLAVLHAASGDTVFSRILPVIRKK
ncbi:MAG: cytochrome b/b6 domain-containing protein [Ghiorsea sp.]|nr:cytochrome b/b6 domain-containing protein [Ghiorsea sp.]